MSAPVAKFGDRYEYFTSLSKDGVEYSVGGYCRTGDGLFARISALWTEQSGNRKAAFAEFQVLQRPEPLLPYHGAAGLEVLMGEFQAQRLSTLGPRIVVEDLATYRRRDPRTFGPDVFYICDFVDKDRGLRYAEAPFKSTGQHAVRVQRHVASNVSKQEVEQLKEAPVATASAAAAESEEKVRSYQLVREPGSKRAVPVASQREAAAMPKAAPPVEPPRASKKRDIFVVDSEEEREQELVSKGMVVERIDSDGSPHLPTKQLKVSSPAKLGKVVPQGVAKSKVVLTSKLAKKPLELERTKSPVSKQNAKTLAGPKKEKALSEFDRKRQKTFAFLEDDDDDDAWQMESYSSSDDGFFVDDMGEEQVQMPAQFRTMSLKEAFSLWLEFVFFCEHDPLFRKRVDRNPDNAYAAAVRSIDKKIKTASEMLGSGGHWNAVTRDKLTSWTQLQSRQIRSVEGRKCDLCGKALGEVLYGVQLLGQMYDGNLFWEKGILGVRKKADPEEICVGESCMQKAVHFHKLNHFKLRALLRMGAVSEELVKTNPSLAGDANAKVLMEAVLRKCAEPLLEEMTALIDKAVGKELKTR